MASRPRPPLFRALGESDPPTALTVDGHQYSRIEIYKHDSWAATALYSGAPGLIVCKFNRLQPILGLPGAWLGKRLAEREKRALERLSDLPAIPRVLGPVFAEGRRLPNAVARVYVPGHPLGKRERVGPAFIASLRRTIIEMHERGIAYVDLHKRENVIVGDDGQPHLVDFQISIDVTHPRLRWILGIDTIFDCLRAGDLYHLEKHVRHSMIQGETNPPPSIPLWLQYHRLLAVPFREFRRRLLVAVGIRQGRGSVTTEVFAEDAVRDAAHAA